jgi:uncharacterized protein
MDKKIVFPEEIIVWQILPYLRREIAIELKKKGLDQKEIAKMLRVTEPAISQYLNRKRAQGLKVSPSIRKEIIITANKLMRDKNQLAFEMHRLVFLPEVKRLLCLLHIKEFGASKNCRLCEI